MAEGLRRRKDSLSDEFDSEIDDNDVKAIVHDIEQDMISDEKPDTRWSRVKSTVKEWGESATFHGIPHIVQATTFIAVVVWSIILIICAFVFVYMFSTTVRQYLKFNYVVNLNAAIESAPFPSITFCNTNPYKLSKMSDVPELAALLSVYQSSGTGNLNG
ncbi:unnamed protein product [Caenorhabditis bovis]|uniref:Uncharacterized protein n=1 Tax=Caenorhabditis bovis TaxID=2654633 RepID=A0A8S1EY38_9PELO|nr:unnamed protein product [Caenorhabditis bovis]